MQKLLTFFFNKNISVYAIFNDQSFNDTLTNDRVLQWTLPTGKLEASIICFVLKIVSSKANSADPA